MIKSLAVICAALLAILSAEARAVTMAWSPVGNPGNPADTAIMIDGTTGYGSVPYSYKIGTYDVTNSQYAEFLNAKDPTGANSLALWNTDMADATYGGISFSSGNPNGSKYTLVAGRQNHPVNDVNWYDTIRFANWLNNGQGNGNTETGAYTLLGGTPTPSNGNSITRNPGATVFLPNENEWYKAAYYSPATSSYFQYPTSSNTAPIASMPTALPNHANYNNAVGNLTDVGAYTGTTSPYGAFDMGGNVTNWNETLGDHFMRGVRTGAFFGDSGFMRSSERISVNPQTYFIDYGFRPAMVPEPPSLLLTALGFLSITVAGFNRFRKRRGVAPHLAK